MTATPPPANEAPLRSPSAPRYEVDFAARVDEIGTRQQIVRGVRITLAIILALIGLIPVFWMASTAFKSRADVIAVPPKVAFTPTMEGFVYLLTDRSVLSRIRLRRMQEQAEDLAWYDRVALASGQRITGPSQYVTRLRNSLIIAGGSTLLAVALGLLAAYAFSRFKVPGESDLLFFILSTRMLPAVVVTIPIFIMYRELGLHDTHLGLILLYTVFNLSLTVWLLKGFLDEIPREYEEAAMVDGYTRMQALRKVVLPQAVTGIAATTVFALIFAWNEYAFALMLTTERARTAPPSIPTILGRGGIEWSAIAAGTLGFLIPVVIVTFALRQYLLRGVTFGAIRQ
jgi:multiple sugar transport system permease protein